MSRAGRFSTDVADLAPETFSPAGAHLGDLSDMSEEEEGLEELEEPDADSSDSSFDEGSLSPTAQAARDEAHRLRDEKRLQSDLSKHRELLIDSQKMNQSLKRCLGWTEALIKDGQKALEYKVHASDIRLGGRVLISEDDHETSQAEESRGLLSPWSPLHHAMDALESPFFPGPDHYIDRDSGVDLGGVEHVDAVEIAETVQDDASATVATNSSPVEEFRPRVPGRWESYAATSTNPSGLDADEDASPLGSPFEERIRHLQASIDALGAS